MVRVQARAPNNTADKEGDPTVWITVYTQKHCPQCDATTRWLNKHGVPYQELPAERWTAVTAELGHKTAPVIILVNEQNWVIQDWSGYRPDRLKAILEEVTA